MNLLWQDQPFLAQRRRIYVGCLGDLRQELIDAPQTWKILVNRSIHPDKLPVHRRLSSREQPKDFYSVHDFPYASHERIGGPLEGLNKLISDVR
jgi:hypothetical protein